MRKYGKKLTIGAVVLVLTMTLAACGGNNGTSGGGDAAPATGEGTGTQQAQPAQPDTGDAGEGRRITTGMQASAVQVFFDGDNYHDNRWTRLIYDRLDIEVDVVFTADTTTEAYETQMNMMLITGDIPDVVRWGDANWLVQAQSAGLLMDITDLFETYARPEIQAFREYFPEAFAGVTFNGRMYGFPFLNDNFHAGSYLWIRDDWLAYAGGQPPTTIEEMVEMARVFANGDPNGDGSTAFGLGVHRDIVASSAAGTLTGLLSGFGVPSHGPGGVFFRGDDGQITFSHIMPEVRYALEVVRDMYAEGLIDPEFVTMDGDSFSAAVSDGRYGMMFHRNWGTWHPFNLSFQSSGVITRPYPVPVAPGHQRRIGLPSNTLSEYFVISADAPDPRAIIEILNLYYEIAVGFEDEEVFMYYWDNEQYRLAPIFIGIPTELHAPAIFEAFQDGGANITGVARQTWVWAEAFEDGTDDSPSAYGTWGQMNPNGTMAIALNIYRPEGAMVDNLMAAEIPDIWLQNSSILNTILETMFTDIIRGTLPLDAFDTFVEQWLLNGGQETLDQLEVILAGN